MNGIIFDIKEMAVHDGPGLRTTVFFKGCPLRCIWCHNPEGLISRPQLCYKANCCIDCGKCKENCTHPECQEYGRCLHICPNNCLSVAGKAVTAKELANELIECAKILGNSFGGFTFSGGEPLAQSEFLLEVIDELSDYHLCIETAGYCNEETFKEYYGQLIAAIKESSPSTRRESITHTSSRDSTSIPSSRTRMVRSSPSPLSSTVHSPLSPQANTTCSSMSPEWTGKQSREHSTSSVPHLQSAEDAS